VSAAVPGATLAMVGKGAMEAELRAQVRNLGLDGSVQFVGHVPHEEIARLLDSSTCLVLPSRSEGLPRVALEAMTRGRPIVGSTGGGIPDAVQDGINGRLVPSGHAQALAEALIEVLSDPAGAQAMGDEGRRRVESWNPAEEFEAGVARLAEWAAILP
jgi:glycosyltransferase involved in cell wall biosynthesis